MSIPERLAEHVWRVPLPTATLPPFDHVNTYLVASDGIGAVVDPGSPGAASLEATQSALDAAGVRLVKAVFLTHTHRDHTDGLDELLEAVGDCAVYVHPLEADRVAGRPGLVRLEGDRRIAIGNALVRSLHTPGHSPGHLSYLLDEGGTALVGDLVAGRGSSWVGLPEGDVSAYLESVARLRGLRPRLLGPGHGPPVRDADRKLADSAGHRLARERQVLDALAGGQLELHELRERVYPEVSSAAAPFAERSLLAHLAKLMREMKVLHLGEGPSGPYALRR